MADERLDDWSSLRGRILGQCSGCPRNASKSPLVFQRRSRLSDVEFIVVSQEPGHWLRPLSLAAEERLLTLCRDRAPSDEVKKANPLVKLHQIFGGFDPTTGKVYWTHALKCVPLNGDRDINKEWRKAATRCKEFFIEELRLLGRNEINVLAFGKYGLELCLDVFDGQDIDQELSISEFMQNAKLPLSYKYKFKDGTVKSINLFIFTNPSSEVVKVMKSGGKMTVEEIQDIEISKLVEKMKVKPGKV